MNNRNNTWIWLILAFVLGVLACHLFYYRGSSRLDAKIVHELEILKKENQKTQWELDKVDSLLNLLPDSTNSTHPE
ncbi:MAG: hypothetical protein JW801_04870 [Bacteroidales bacterium]|nr:hypothetical protein [Bacteroidales bacterium]